MSSSSEDRDRAAGRTPQDAARPAQRTPAATPFHWAPGRWPWALLAILGIASLSMVFIPLLSQFAPADDYVIYTHFAEAVCDGHNPYSLPTEYRSTVPPSIFPVGHTQVEPGRIRERYADYPPLLMLVNSWAFRLHPLKGLFWLYVLLYGVSCVLYCVYGFSDRRAHQHNPLCFLVLLAISPLINRFWFWPIEDKVWFLLLILVCLLLRRRHYGLTVALAIFAALKYLGVVVFALYLAFLLFNKSAALKPLVRMALVFAAILAASHCLWFPEWVHAYEWRASHWRWVGHASLFVPLAKAGWQDWGCAAAKMLTVSAFGLLGLATVRRRLTVQEVLVLPVVISLVFNTAMNFDRLFVVVLALLLLAEGNLPIVLAYAAGALVTTPLLQHFLPVLGTFWASWFALWSLVAVLAFGVVRQILRRSAPSGGLNALAQGETTGEPPAPG